MKIFEANMELKMENERLKRRISVLEQENLDVYIKIEERYKKEYERKLEFEKARYRTKMEMKKEVKEIIEDLQNKIHQNLVSLIDTDVTNDVECYLKLLKFLKEE